MKASWRRSLLWTMVMMIQNHWRGLFHHFQNHTLNQVVLFNFLAKSWIFYFLNLPPSKKPRITITSSSSNPMKSRAIEIFSPPQQKCQKLKQTKLQMLALLPIHYLILTIWQQRLPFKWYGIVHNHPVINFVVFLSFVHVVGQRWKVNSIQWNS